MLTITVLGEENFDEESQEFIYPESYELQLEHSLVSLSKWESIHEKPFLGKEEKSNEEALSYIYCMIVTPNVPESVVKEFSDENIGEIQQYIDRKMTATWFSEVQPESRNSEIITSELIYYWMSQANIPVECENWHLSRLFTLLKIHGAKNSQPKKMSRSEIAARQRELNERRRKELGSSG